MSEPPTEQFLEQCRNYLSNDSASLRECGDKLEMLPTAFLQGIRQLFRDEFLVLKGKIDHAAGVRFSEFCLDTWHRYVAAHVVDGAPDDDMFAYTAAECLLGRMRRLLEASKKEVFSLGLFSGTSVCRTVDKMCQGRLWDEVMAGLQTEVKGVNVLALAITPLIDEDLIEGNANNAVSRLAARLREKLPRLRDDVHAFGLASTLVVSVEERNSHDSYSSNARVVEIADPDRLTPGAESELDFVVTGVGGRGGSEDSVFMRVLDQEKIRPPDGMIGDLAFQALNAAGDPLRLPPVDQPNTTATSSAREAGQREIYGAVRLSTLQELVKPEAKAEVLLIARNWRRGKEVDKTDAMTAALKAGYVNALISDGTTIDDIVRRMRSRQDSKDAHGLQTPGEGGTTHRD